jgi:hypothetical protein
MHCDQTEKAEDNVAVSVVVARYYHHLESHGKRATLHIARTVLGPAISQFGFVKVKELKPVHVEDWLAKQTAWNSTTKHTAVAKLTRAFNMTVKGKEFTRSPWPG